MIYAEVRDGKVDELRALLASMNKGPGEVDPANKLMPFAQFDCLHFARFLVVEHNIMDDIRVYDLEPRPWAPMLVFLGDCDGPFEQFLAEMAVRAGPGLQQIFSLCEGFNAERDDVLQWMLAKNRKPSANYVNWVGRTVVQIKEEDQLRHHLSQAVDQIQQSHPLLPPRLLHQTLRENALDAIGRGEIRVTPVPRTPFGWWLKNCIHLIGVPLILLLLSPVLLIALPFVLVYLRRLEKTDPEIVPRPEWSDLKKLRVSEDQMVTNQFSAFGDSKPGWFRRYLTTFLLIVLDYTARHIYNRGTLTRITTIHFARWIQLDGKNRMLFCSNYDGSLESYMDDFVNKVAWGLNLVFSNGLGYPSARFLIKGGAEQEQKYKKYLGRHQMYTDVWYKAYPSLSAVDLARNSKIRLGLEQASFKTDAEVVQWLNLI